MHDCVCELVHIILMRLVLNPDWDSALQLQNVDLVPGGRSSGAEAQCGCASPAKKKTATAS